MSCLTQQRIAAIQEEVFSWYAANKRDLSWRKTNDPYAILVSEIMLQQTQVSRVMPKFEAFLLEFPTIESLAVASPAAVIRAWKGLGYNRRALNLQRAARVIIEQSKISPRPSLSKRGVKHAGRGASPFAKGDRGGFGAREIFPTTVQELTELPGIGRYTAGAVATFAFGAIAPAVDTNVKRFLDSLVPTRTNRTEADYYELAAQLIPSERPAEWLHAVMDYTSLVLRARRSILPPPPRGSQSSPPRRSRKDRSEPFIGSNRYLRGRVIDLLRIRPETRALLFRRIAQPVMVAADRFGEILDSLVLDELIERRATTYRLTE